MEICRSSIYLYYGIRACFAGCRIMRIKAHIISAIKLPRFYYPEKYLRAERLNFPLLTSAVKLLLVSLSVQKSLYMDRKTEQVDKSCGILLVVNVVLVEGSEISDVQIVRRCNARVDDVALGELQLNAPVNGFLGLVYECVHSLAQGSVPLTVVYDVSVLMSQARIVVLSFLLKPDGVKNPVCVVTDGYTGGTVTETGVQT